MWRQSFATAKLGEWSHVAAVIFIIMFQHDCATRLLRSMHAGMFVQLNPTSKYSYYTEISECSNTNS